MKLTSMLLSVFWLLAAASDGPAGGLEAPYVEILGVRIARGMSESDVRNLLPVVACDQWQPGHFSCGVSDGELPDLDGEIEFRDGLVHSASRNWFIPEDAEPVDVLLLLNGILTRMTGEDTAACAKVETVNDAHPTYTIFVLPEKVLTVQTLKVGRRGARFVESLRVNPVPATYKTRGRKSWGTDWCAYVN